MFAKGSAVLFLALSLTACGGGAGGQSSFSASGDSSPVALSSASSQSSQGASSAMANSSPATQTVSLSGNLTYDFVPHSSDRIGLNYAATEKRPIRGAVVELLNDGGLVIGKTISSADGFYAFEAPRQQMVRVRVKAELLSNQAPTWDFKVTDNTASNAVYVLDGNLVDSGPGDSRRDLHAPSGWDGVRYANTRAAAPFAILDTIYLGAQRLLSSGATNNMVPLELRWSTRNTAARGDLTRGEIDTSFYNGSAIYVLGDADHDTDEYDPHVLLHEWGHYLEETQFRSDSIGGSHADGQTLDIRVAMSEGFANAFSAIVLNDPIYADASGPGQTAGSVFNVSRRSRFNKGYFSEGSVAAVLFNFYSSSMNKTGNDFSQIYKTLSHPGYYNNPAMTSIFLLEAQMRALYPAQMPLFESMLHEQNINGIDEYGAGETNDGGSAFALPLYKNLAADNSATKVCSTAEFGKHNKLTNSQFLKLEITQSGTYTLRLNKSASTTSASQPEAVVYQQGMPLAYVRNTIADSASGSFNLTRGIYIVEIYDVSNHNPDDVEKNTLCFDVRIGF